jgi:hypothetical protein
MGMVEKAAAKQVDEKNPVTLGRKRRKAGG